MSDKKKATKNNKSNQDKLSNLSKSIKKIIKEDIHTTSNKFTKNKFKKTNERSTTHLNNIPDADPQDKEVIFQKAKNLYEQVYYFPSSNIDIIKIAVLERKKYNE